MKFLFLDIDGVLNSDAYFSSNDFSRAARWTDAAQIDASAVAKLNVVIEKSGARLVLSSDWRKSPPNPGLYATEAALRQQGATFFVRHATPVLTESQRIDKLGVSWAGNYTPRWLEIQCWLDSRAYVSQIAIVDDEPDMAHLNDRLVVTKPVVGLTDCDCVHLLALLA